MPLQLTTPLNVGAVDVNSPYQQVKILEFTMQPQAGRISLVVLHGNTISSSWVPGKAIEGTTVKRFQIDGDDYQALVASTSAAAGEIYYDKVASLLYQWLIDKGGFAGTIV